MCCRCIILDRPASAFAWFIRVVYNRFGARILFSITNSNAAPESHSISMGFCLCALQLLNRMRQNLKFERSLAVESGHGDPVAVVIKTLPCVTTNANKCSKIMVKYNDCYRESSETRRGGSTEVCTTAHLRALTTLGNNVG